MTQFIWRLCFGSIFAYLFVMCLVVVNDILGTLQGFGV